jgi:hypothetical protein
VLITSPSTTKKSFTAMQNINFNRNLLTATVENCAALYLSFHMAVYGIAKAIQFKNLDISSKTIAELTGKELVWVFMGYNQLYPIMIGTIQLLGSLLCITPKYRVIGCLVLLPITINIVLIDYFYQVSHGALITSIICAFSIFIILLIKYKMVCTIILSLVDSSSPTLSVRTIVIYAMAVVLFLLAKLVEYQVLR